MNRDKIIMKQIKTFIYIFTVALCLAVVTGYAQAAEKKQTVTTETVEVKGKKQATKPAPKKVEPKKTEEKKQFDPNRKVPTLKKKYRKE
jgi:hypothetical protein